METTNEACTSGEDRAWRAVWKLNVPPKVRVFWWRVLHKFLPAKSELKRRHVIGQSFCEMCGDPDESVFHVFVLCPVARRFWAEVKKSSGIQFPNLHPSTWATDLFHADVCPPTEAAMFICGAWTLWNRRNACRYGRKVWEPGAMVRYISSVLEDLSMLKISRKKEEQPRRDKQWKPPGEGWVKVNTDAGFDAGACTGRAGVVILDHTGRVAAAASRWFDNVPDVLTAEAMAAKEGVELAVELGYDRVILEVNCLVLKKMLEDREGVQSSVGGFCFDILELSRSFSVFRVEWVCRDANSVDHFCTSWASATERSIFWLDDILDWLLGLAVGDCTPISD